LRQSAAELRTTHEGNVLKRLLNARRFTRRRKGRLKARKRCTRGRTASSRLKRRRREFCKTSKLRNLTKTAQSSAGKALGSSELPETAGKLSGHISRDSGPRHTCRRLLRRRRLERECRSRNLRASLDKLPNGCLHERSDRTRHE